MSKLADVYLYCAGMTTFDGSTDYYMVAIADDGEVLAEHACSHPGFGLGDLHNRPYRHAAYESKFGGWGDGVYYRIVEVDLDDPRPAGLVAAIEASPLTEIKRRWLDIAHDPRSNTLYGASVTHRAMLSADAAGLRGVEWYRHAIQATVAEAEVQAYAEALS